MQGLTAFERHKKLLREYEALYGGQSNSIDIGLKAVKTDEDTLKEQHRFIRTEDDDKEGQPWEIDLARKYYSRLFKEYAIIDLSRYKEGQIGCRWRTHAEVMAGKGQFSCGTKTCSKLDSIETFEVPFQYAEAGKQKNALVKVRLCQEHGLQLNYRRNKEVVKRQTRKRKHKGSPSDVDETDDNSAISDSFNEAQEPKRGPSAARTSTGGERYSNQTEEAKSSQRDIEAEVDKFLDELMP